MRCALVLGLLALACQPERGVAHKPMSVENPKRQAEQETIRVREQYAAQDAARSDIHCGTDDHRFRFGELCWTVGHADAADRERRAAQRHRAASAALRDAEARSCADVDVEDRDLSPFVHRRDIRSVRAIEESTAYASSSRIAGAQIVFDAVPGMSATRLRKIVDCHLARNAAIGAAAASAAMPYCPLTLPGVRAEVSSVDDGFAVAVTAEDDATAQEIVRRSQQLVDRP